MSGNGGIKKKANPADLPDEAVELIYRCFDLARHGDLTELITYLDAGLPLNIADGHGNSMLMLAAYHGHAHVVRELARRGADVDQLNSRGQSPLAGAVFKGEDDVVTTLVQAGADADAGTPSAREAAAYFRRDLPGQSGAAPG